MIDRDDWFFDLAGLYNRPEGLALSIEWQIGIVLIETDDGSTVIKAGGKHDGFLGYELQIGGLAVYRYNPGAHGQSPLSLVNYDVGTPYGSDNAGLDVSFKVECNNDKCELIQHQVD